MSQAPPLPAGWVIAASVHVHIRMWFSQEDVRQSCCGHMAEALLMPRASSRGLGM